MADNLVVLLMSTDQLGLAYMRLGEEVREIHKKVQAGTFHDAFDFKVHPAVQVSDLEMLLMEYRPQIVHLSGHGTPAHGIILEGEDGRAIPVGADELSGLVYKLKDNVRLAFLNVCYSKRHAEAIAQVIDFAIGMDGKIKDESAIALASSFYRALAYGRSIEDAFEIARRQLEIIDPESSQVPVLVTRKGADASAFSIPQFFIRPAVRESEAEALLRNLGSQFVNQLRIAGHFQDADDSEQAIYLDDNLYVHRAAAENQILSPVVEFAALAAPQGKWLSVIGDAGHGKSSLLWYLYNRLQEDGRLRIAPFLGQLENDWSRIEATALAVKPALPPACRLIVIIDTLDILVGIEDAALAAMLNALRSAGCLVITSSRRQEEERIFRITPSDIRVELKRYTDDEAQQAIRNYIALAHPAWSAADRALQFDGVWGLLEQQRDARELDLEPLILRMLFEAYHPKEIPQDVNTQQVYQDFWHERVLFDRVVKDANERLLREQICRLIARQLAFGAEQSEKLSINALSKIWEAERSAALPYSTIEGLVSTGVLQWAEGASTFRFFHQTFFEYAAAYDLLSSEAAVLENGIRKLLEDVSHFNLFHAPILKQLILQAYAHNPDRYRQAMRELREVNNELAALLALEIVGKLPRHDYALKLCKAWIAEDRDTLQDVICQTVRHYPRNKADMALDLLAPYLKSSKSKVIYSMCADTFAKDAPRQVYNLLHHHFPQVAEADDDEKTHYRQALTSVLRHGITDALTDLLALFPHLRPGQQAGLLYRLAEVHIEGDATEVTHFLMRVIESLPPGRGAKQAEVWDGVLQVANQLHAQAPAAGEELARWLISRDNWKADQLTAQYTGRMVGPTVSDPARIEEALSAIASDDHYLRLMHTDLLSNLPERFAADLMRRILLLPKSLDQSVAQISSLFAIVASLKQIEPHNILQFLGAWPWQDSGVGTPLRLIIEYLAEADPAATKTWLFNQLRSGAGPGGDKLYTALNILAQINIQVFERAELRLLYETAFRLSKAIKQRFAGMIGSIAKLDRELADEAFSRVFNQEGKDCQLAAVNSLTACSPDAPDFVLAQSDRVLQTALANHQLGLLHGYLIVLKSFPRTHARLLLRHLHGWLSAAILHRLSDEKSFGELLTILKIFAEADPRLTFDFSKRIPLTSQGVAGGVTALYDQITEHSADESLLIDLLESLPVVCRFNQVRMGNALKRILPRLDEKLGRRKVADMVLNAYQSIQNEQALKTFIEAAAKIPSWTEEDTTTLLRDPHLPGLLRGLLSVKSKH